MSIRNTSGREKDDGFEVIGTRIQVKKILVGRKEGGRELVKG